MGLGRGNDTCRESSGGLSVLGVLSGFSVIWAVILFSYVIGRLNVLGPEAQRLLSRLVYFVATPA